MIKPQSLYHREWRAANKERVAAQKREYYFANKNRLLKRAKKWRLLHPVRTKEASRRHTLKRHGLCQQDFDKLYKKQKGKCAICKEAITGKHCHVDHCHLAGLNRSLLCRRCNLGLGNFLDKVTLLVKAVKYLEKWNVRNGSKKL